MAGQTAVEILLVEDSPLAVKMVRRWLDDGLHSPFNLHSAGTLAEGEDQLKRHSIDLVVLDLNLPDSEGLDTFHRMHEMCNGVAIVIMSGESDEELAVTAVRSGAQDYVVKGSFLENPLARPVRYALERVGRRRLEKELRRTQEQLFLAQAVQQQMLPTASPEIPGFDIAGRCDPADEAGGDYFDFFPMLGGRWGIALGDVAGHGLKSAFFMVSARAVVRAFNTTYGDVGYVMTRGNEVLEHDMHNQSFVTMILLALDPAARTLRFASAGHPAHLLDSSGEVKLRLSSESPPLGITTENDYVTSEPIVLTPGDLVLLHTDGLTETHDRSGEQFGETRMFDVVKQNRHAPAEEIIDNLFQAADDFRDGQVQGDDVTAVVVKCK